MADTKFTISLLANQHDRAAFSCGEPSLDSYLQKQAKQDTRRDAAVTYVLTVDDSAHVLGYYTLNADSVSLTDLPADVQKKLARYARVGASKLGRLAVDERYKGKGLGAELLYDALKRSLALADDIGIAVVIVDALNDNARRFYEKYGFQLLVDSGDKLFIPIKTLRKSLNL